MNRDVAIQRLDAAAHALAECKAVMEAKQIADVAEAARVYLERTNASVDTVNRATEVRLLAERQMGEFLREMPKNEGTRGNIQEVVTGGTKSEPPEHVPTLAEIGISKKQSAQAQKLAAIPQEEFQERVAVAKAGNGKLSLGKVINIARETRRAAPKPETRSQFRDRFTNNINFLLKGVPEQFTADAAEILYAAAENLKSK